MSAHTDYEASGFLSLQLAIDQAIIAHSNSANNMPSNSDSNAKGRVTGAFTLRLQRHPYPPYDVDYFMKLRVNFLGFYVLFMLCTVFYIVKDVIEEKENKLKVRGGVNKLGAEHRQGRHRGERE